MRLHSGWKGLLIIAAGLSFYVHPHIPPLILIIWGMVLFNGYAFGRLN